MPVYLPIEQKISTHVVPVSDVLEISLEIQVQRMGKQQATSAGSSAEKRRITTDKRWVPPDIGKLKITVDGAFDESLGTAGAGVVIRDDKGNPMLLAWSKLFHCRDAEEAEAAACLDGVRLAARWPDNSMILESDCATVVAKINDKGGDRSMIASLISDIKEDGRQLRDLVIRKI
ncbi:hypothetical protein EJB05_30258, partial [Eragrostis curvula]